MPTRRRLLAAASLLARLVRSIEDALRAPLAERFASHDALHAALTSARVPIALPILERAGSLGDHDLGTVLVRRVEEHRFWKAYGQSTAEDLLFELVRDPDQAIAADAMDLVIARELQVLGSHGMAAHDYPRLLALVASGRLPLARLVSRTLPLVAGPRALAEVGTATAPGVTVLLPG